MSSFFDSVERDLVRAARLRARPRRRLVTLGVTGVLVLGVAGTAAGGTYVALRASGIAPFSADETTPEQRVAPGTSTFSDLRVKDPDPAVPPWTVRVSRSDTGLMCSTVGQVKDEQFGLVGLDGVFRVTPEANADSCGEPNSLLGTRVFDGQRFKDVRTVLNGVAGPDLKRVTVSVRGGAPREVPHAKDGAFALVLRGYPEDNAPVVTIQTAQSTRRYDFAGSDGTTVPDPYGLPSWRLMTSSWTDIPKYFRTCVNFSSARTLPGTPTGASPQVCGLIPRSPRIKAKPPFFITQRITGGGNWGKLPPRTAVWGTAWGHKQITVRAGSFVSTVKPRRNAAFLVFLPQSTDPANITVEIDGKHYGNTSGTVK